MNEPLLPIVGIICITIRTQERLPRLCQNRAYIDALIRAGAVPLLIPHLTDKAMLRTVYEQLDGLLLPGGEDVDPIHYGESRHEKCGPSSLERDETELTLSRWAIEEGKPLLAICRGIQVLNVALGGTLVQDLHAQVPGAEKHDWYPGYPRDNLPHTVAVEPQTRLSSLVGSGSLAVNSLHHQAIKEVAAGLIVAARAPDRVVEAVEIKDHPFALAVQWHPEELARDDARAQCLFDALASASRSRRLPAADPLFALREEGRGR
jgi:putative glutamine amidotransferase